MTGFRSFNNSTCKRVLNLSEAGYLRRGEVTLMRITVIEFGVNDGSSYAAKPRPLMSDKCPLRILAGSERTGHPTGTPRRP